MKETVLRRFNLKFFKGAETKGKNTIILVVIFGKSRHEAAKTAVKIAFLSLDIHFDRGTECSVLEILKRNNYLSLVGKGLIYLILSNILPNTL